MRRLLLVAGVVSILGGCAKPADPRGDISRAVVILLCTTESGSTDSRVAMVLKNSSPDVVRVAMGDIASWPLVDKEFTRSYPLRVVIFEAEDPKFLAQLSGPRSEFPVVDGRIPHYGLSLEEFRRMVEESRQGPNQPVQPTPGSVTPRASEGTSK